MADDTTDDTTAEPDDADVKPPTDDLGDAGKRALDAERKAARAAERKAKDLEKRLAEIEAQNQTEAEKAIAAAKAEGRTEALSVANRRIVTAEVKAAAAGVLQDPDDAVRLLDLDAFEVGDDGEVDIKAIKAEVAALAKAKPYLSVGAKPAPLPAGGATPSSGPSMDDLLRGAARRGGGGL